MQGFAAFHLTWGFPAFSLEGPFSSQDTDANPTVAIDPRGNAVAAWGRTTGGGASENVWASCYDHSSRRWTASFLISGGGSASHPAVAMDQQGNALILWEEGFPTQILYRTLSAQGAWDPPLGKKPFSVTPSPQAQTFPHIAIDESGQAIAIWLELTKGLSRICSAKKPFAKPWQSLGVLSAEADTEIHRAAPMAMNLKGEALVVWETAKGFIYGAHFGGALWSPPFYIGVGKDPSVALDGGGHGVIVWNQDQVIQSKDFANQMLAASQQGVSVPNFKAQRPTVALDERGHAIAVYERFDASGSLKFVTGATKPFDQAAWSSPIDISVPTPAVMDAAGYPLLSVNAIGDGVAVWKGYNEGKMVIQGAGYSLGTWSFIPTLSAPDGSSKGTKPGASTGYNFDVSVNDRGQVITVWPEGNEGQVNSVPGVGLAVESPPPPQLTQQDIAIGVGTGRQVVHRFPAHADYINILDWVAPAGVSYYKIYRGNLSSLVGTTSSPHYEDHQREPRKAETYLITSVDIHEHESVPLAILVAPK
jgi:hypothetical protein